MNVCQYVIDHAIEIDYPDVEVSGFTPDHVITVHGDVGPADEAASTMAEEHISWIFGDWAATMTDLEPDGRWVLIWNQCAVMLLRVQEQENTITLTFGKRHE